MMRLNKFAFIVTIIAFLASVNTASAQWYLSPRAGLSMMMLSDNEPTSTSSLMGIHGGVSVRKQLSKQINVQADVLYSQMGGNSLYQVDVAGQLTEYDINNTFTYVQVPIYANIEFPIKSKRLVPYFDKESWSSFHLYGGAYFGYGLDNEQEITTTVYDADGGVFSNETATLTMGDTVFSPIDFGIMVGAGFSFKLDEEDKQRLGIDIRYILGLADVAKGSFLPINNVPEVNTAASASLSALQISLYYQFKLTNRRHIRYAR